MEEDSCFLGQVCKVSGGGFSGRKLSGKFAVTQVADEGCGEDDDDKGDT